MSGITINIRHYLKIDEKGLCYEVCTTTYNCDELKGYMAIISYDEVYIGKYYINNAWYEDELGTIPFNLP